ncbi:hypothetical protein A0J61_07573 [Choanephora cucurbitarum]|uniref:SH3 domain-containing protein n=1 Tax=Choanephora cucurbitarum TaxID=101091 RepID=A0A1C7N5H2_9FUNG|nr:hypothetical protein A0J61_07573 [Choanephora cucurbitarum]
MRMKAVYDCSADESGELSFKEGDILVDVVDSGEEGWYKGRILNTSSVGLFPYNYVVQVPDEPVPKEAPLDAFEAAMMKRKPGASAKALTLEKAKSQPTHMASPTRLRSHSASSVLAKSVFQELDKKNSTPRQHSALRGSSDTSVHTKEEVEEDEEEGYHMVKPSQLKQALNTDLVWLQKTKKAQKDFLNNMPNTTKSSQLTANSSSNPMPRLPSRPVSAAVLKSRQNRNAKPKEITPKPKLQPVLPPRPSKPSTSSNAPPPIHPKPAMSSIEILLNRNNNSNKQKPMPEEPLSSSSVTMGPTPTSSKSMRPKKPDSNSKPNLVTRTDNWASNHTDDANIKPSALFNRARSATNPNTSSTHAFDWESNSTKSLSLSSSNSPSVSNTILPPPPPASRTIPVQDRLPTPIAQEATKTTTDTKKRANPPPPPPSRPSSKSAQRRLTPAEKRYESLFQTVQDQGLLDGETVHCIWIKSKLSNEDLARIWRECDPNHKGVLDKQAFLDGMTKIDECLATKQAMASQ